MPWTVADVDRHNAGLSDAQKRKWVAVANTTRKRCLDGGGSETHCDATAVRAANGACANSRVDTPHVEVNQYTTREELYQGQRHLIVPVVMMVEGVHNGSHGPLFHPAEELGRFVASWNGIPVTVQHPQEDGSFVSANAPNVLDRQMVGRVFNAHMEDNKLKGEVWVDVNRIQTVSPSTLAMIRAGRQLEVSLGVFTDDEFTEGTWHNEAYVAVARNHRPDHLALLPGSSGACSWDDGCGIRANERIKSNMEGGAVSKIFLIDKQMTANAAPAKTDVVLHIIGANEQGYRQIMQNIQTKLDRMDDDIKVHFLTDVFDDHFIYEVRSRAGVGGDSAMYRRNYTANTDGAVEFTGEPVAVQRRVEYVPVNNNSETNKKEEPTTLAETTKKTPCCPGKVQALIDSKHYTEADREWLSALEEPQVNRLVDMNALLVQAENKPVPQITKDQALQVLSGKMTADEYKSLMPADVRDAHEAGMKLYAEKRTSMVTKILAHSGNKFTEAELKAMTTDMLEKLEAMVPVPHDYSALGGGGSEPGVNAEDFLMPGGLETAEKTKEGGK